MISALLASTVEASATTSVQLSNLVNYQSGTPVEFTVNGVTLTNFADLGELADAINDDENLKARGIIAQSDGETLSLVVFSFCEGPVFSVSF